MNDITTFIWIAVGVFVAIVYPLLWGYFRKAWPQRAAPGLPEWVTKYGVLLVLGLVGGFIIFISQKASHPNTSLEWYQGALLGFGGEASIEKILNPPAKPK
jgi:hypothetical protein